MKKTLMLAIAVAISLMSCQNNGPESTEYKGIVIKGNPCTGPSSIVVKVLNREINSTHVTTSGEVQNVLVGYINGVDMLASDTTILFENKSVDLRDTLSFSFEEGRIPAVFCPALYSIPRLQGRITRISN